MIQISIYNISAFPANHNQPFLKAMQRIASHALQSMQRFVGIFFLLLPLNWHMPHATCHMPAAVSCQRV